MSFAAVSSAQATLLSAHIITIEVDISSGALNAFSIVGLPDKAVEESRDRIAAAIKNTGFDSPKATNQKTVISLAPADLKKEGSAFELGMAMAYLLATEDVAFDPTHALFLGELALDGTLRPIRGVLPLARAAQQHTYTHMFVPRENAEEAAIIDGITIYPAASLTDVVAHVSADSSVALTPQPPTVIEHTPPETSHAIDLSDIRGQEHAKRAITIAAAGGHNIALSGPPGAGKSMLAKALAGILPELSFNDALDVTSIHSVAGTLDTHIKTVSPFRAPHHTSSHVSVVGGGTIPKPGEITLAHKGVLFLDEFPEFDRRVIETLRQPLEDREVSISRAGGTARFPADIILVAAMNPCPCGNYGVEGKRCTCTAASVERYRRKISGPIVDRIDLWVDVPAVAHELLLQKRNNAEKHEASTVRDAIVAARTRQAQRARAHHLKQARNSTLASRNIDTVTNLSETGKNALNTAAKQLDLSARSYHRVIKVARTIADLDGDEHVEENHIAEALQYRPKTST